VRKLSGKKTLTATAGLDSVSDHPGLARVAPVSADDVRARRPLTCPKPYPLGEKAKLRLICGVAAVERNDRYSFFTRSQPSETSSILQEKRESFLRFHEATLSTS
jgi:hypothetical protein